MWYVEITALYVPIYFHTLKYGKCSNQGCAVGVGFGVARGLGKESGVGVGVDQAASTVTPKRFVLVCDIICLRGGEFAYTSWK